ncbi:hypothetical protein PTKIN_Ptkin17bG0169200 [Pterospermum kingtungense]
METAIRGRLTLSPNTVFNPKPGEKESLCKGPCINHGILMAISTTGPGILEKPVIERTTPGREYKFDLRRDAEEHCMQIRGNGLLSSIEPDSGGC